MKNVLLLLAQGFEEYEASVFTDVFGWSRIVGDIPVNVTTAGFRPEIKCTWNFTVIPEIDASSAKVDEFDALAIPGGFQKAGFYKDSYREDFLDLIRAFDRGGKIIGAVCVGALPLGKSGVLKNRKATTYHLLNGLRRKQLANFGAEVLDCGVAVDGNIITSASPATALDVAFKMLTMLTTNENCEKVRTAMRFVSSSGHMPETGIGKSVKETG